MNDFLQNLPNVNSLDVRLFAAAINATSNGVVITDHSLPDEPIIYCNKAFQQLTGYTRDEIIGHNCRFLQGDENNQQAVAAIHHAVENGEHCQVELRNFRKDGSLFWNELIISPVKDDAGKVAHFIGVQNDVTLRKDAEKALHDERGHLEERVKDRTHDLAESESYLASIVETIRESLVVVDADMRILTVNEHFCKFFKVTSAAVSGKVLFELGSGQWNISRLKDLLQNVLPHNNPFEGFELENDFEFIGRKLLIINARQITLKGKYQDRVLLAIEDITERRAIEQRKEDFISIASHEMKTPLTSIKGNLQLLQRRAVKNNDNAYLKGFETASKSVDRLDKLINDLLDVAKIQSGRIEFFFTSFFINDLVKDAVEAVQTTTDTHRIVIEGSSPYRVYADFGRLEQVVINLLTNAIKYSPGKREVMVHISTLTDYIKVSITDSGVGIKREDLKKVFDRFYRADMVTEKFPGFGIGLFISKQIVQEHKGTLWAESTEGEGSVFSFTIPLNRSKDE